MLFHGEVVEVGDRVFDVSAKRGFGRVYRVNEASFEVEFTSSHRLKLIYDTDGKAKGESRTTLYWNVPVVLKPTKDEHTWNQQQELLDAIITFAGQYSKIIQG